MFNISRNTDFRIMETAQYFFLKMEKFQFNTLNIFTIQQMIQYMYTVQSGTKYQI